MNYAQIENGEVVNVAVADEAFAAENDLIPCGDAGVGYYYDGTDFIAPPVPALTIQEQIEAFESKQTARLLREAALQNQYAIDKLTAIDSEIAALRSK